MPGPNSAPNGDTTIVRGHINEEFVCEQHLDKHLDICYDRASCKVVPLREHLARRNRLVTGKTQASGRR